jgi:hypothetical protein
MGHNRAVFTTTFFSGKHTYLQATDMMMMMMMMMAVTHGWQKDQPPSD